MSISKEKLHSIIFEADTKEGKFFDEILIILIILSIILVVLESIPSVKAISPSGFRIAEWIITILFTIEYALRIWILKKPLRYAISFYGIIDLLAILPSYLGLVFVGTQSLLVIRSLRLLRIFRILKLTRYTNASGALIRALHGSMEKILVFLFFVLTVVIICGTIMYLIEGGNNGFTDIPTSIYWAIVTLTTVGFGDIAPVTPLGQFVASLIMILGYGVIAVPTGIFTAQILQKNTPFNTQVCHVCMFDKHDDDARFCKRCGTPLDENPVNTDFTPHKEN